MIIVAVTGQKMYENQSLHRTDCIHNLIGKLWPTSANKNEKSLDSELKIRQENYTKLSYASHIDTIFSRLIT